jgi:hypothetical protein
MVSDAQPSILGTGWRRTVFAAKPRSRLFFCHIVRPLRGRELEQLQLGVYPRQIAHQLGVLLSIYRVKPQVQRLELTHRPVKSISSLSQHSLMTQRRLPDFVATRSELVKYSKRTILSPVHTLLRINSSLSCLSINHLPRPIS